MSHFAFRTVVLALLAGVAGADEGMWLLNAPPHAVLKAKYGFEADAAWLEHVRLSSVRFNSGGSGSFVSADGLVMTNHHVGADTLQKVSTAQRNLYRDGFVARTHAEEIPAPDLEINVLIDIEDVTERVQGSVKAGATSGEAFAARRAAIAGIEKESSEKSGLRSDVIPLFQGGRYHLYKFKKYTDVRLVMAPEFAIAFFGGDPDNFEYPRFDLDVCFFRAYENGKPAQVKHWFKWSPAGSVDGELVFVSGHPGSTHRLLTLAELKYDRDVRLPSRLDLLRRREVLLQNFGSRNPENARMSKGELFGIQNARKAILGKLGGLLDPALMAEKAAAEKKLRSAVTADPKMEAIASAWKDLEAALETSRSIRRELNLLEGGSAFNSRLFGISRTLVRLAAEKAKPNAERLREYGEARLPSLELSLYSPAPIYPSLEKVKLADSLSMMAEELGGDHPLVALVLAGKSPSARAAELIDGSTLLKPDARRKLAAGGADAVAASTDPMVRLAIAVDAEARKVRKVYEDKVEGVERTAHEKIAKARFAILGTDTYPDATFTLRLAFGPVKGYVENGKPVPPFTTIAGAYARADEQGNMDPFALPKLWHDRKAKLDLTTPFNFVCTADIIGGNSGSPVINRKAEVVGLIFDGNIQSLVLDYAYTETEARAVSVDSRAIIEALRKVYDADKLADEIVGK